MSYPFPPDVDQLVQNPMGLGGYGSEHELLRDALLALAERHEVLADIRDGLKELEAGGGRPLAEVDANLRQRHGIARE